MATALRSLVGVTGKAHTALDYLGRPTLIVPVVALVGDLVIHAVNAASSELVPLATLSKAPHEWAHKPVVFGHPKKDGVQISANDPTVLERHGLGTVANPRIENGKLCVDAVLDEARVELLGGAKFLQSLRDGVPCEVSVGCFVETSIRAGEQGGRAYKAVWESLQPDHLALLAASRGACNISDGCGTHRAAEAGERVYDILMDGKVMGTLRRGGLKAAGGPGSGWTAENGHVPGAQGGNADQDRRAFEGHGGTATPKEGDRVRIMGKVFGAGKTGIVKYSDSQGSFHSVRDAKGNSLGSFHSSDLKVMEGAEGSAHVKIKEKLKALVMRLNQPRDTPEQAASEEAAELVGYGVVKTLLDQAGATHDEALALVEQLIADESESPTETPAQEDAEEEVEEARLEALRTLCMAAMSTYSAVCSQVGALLMPEPLETDAPRYMAGARNSAADMAVIQKVHDHSVDLGANCHSGNVRALAATGDKSLDDRIQAVNKAVQQKYGNNSNQLMPSTAWARQVYDDHCIVSRGDKLYSVPYTIDKSGVVTLGDTVMEVKQEYVAAAAALSVGDKVTIDKPGHDAHGKAGVIKSSLKGGLVHNVEVGGKAVGAFHRSNLKAAAALTQKERDALPESDFAGKGTSFPIVKPADVAAAASSIGRAGADNYSTDELKANIIRLAKRKGAEFVAQLPESWKAQPKAAGAADQAAVAVETAALKAAEQRPPCGCATKENRAMTTEQKAEAIKTLVNCKHSGFTADDQAMLEAAPDARLESFLVAAEARKNEVEQAKAPKALSADEFMAQAPPELKTLLARQKRQETERKAELVTALKTAQEEYTESELAAMPVEDLERMARMARIAEKPSYAGRGLPRAAQETDVYANPPDPYAEGIKARRAAMGR
jgi:hypothetical protein